MVIFMGNSLPDLSQILSSSSNDYEIKETIKKNNDIAIIGLDVNFPQAENYNEFWDNLINEKDSIRSIPSNRKEEIENYVKLVECGREYQYREIAYLDDISGFDYEFFHLSPKEAALMDPNQRLFLQCVWKTIEDAGYGENQITGSRTGIYVGYKSTLSNVYYDMIRLLEPQELDLAAVGNKTPVIASRIAHILDLKGPNMIIDTACSSSLVAIHLACQALRQGECENAIVGSTRLDILPLENQNKLGIESKDGRTKTFDLQSDGTGGGEGVAAVFLKPFNKAVEDGDHIYAVIKGSAINHDGHAIGLTAPNASAQEDVILRALKSAGITADNLSYIEAHGTGTKLGDPIELEGLTKAFTKFTDQYQFCGIGSVKSNIGHLDNCAGMAGLIKAVLALQNKKIPASLHFYSPNPEINFILSPFYVCEQSQSWETPGIRRCGVSAFGLSGTNCHIILEEAPVCEQFTENKKLYQIISISAKSEDALYRYIKRYQEYFMKHPDGNLESICRTSNCGRGHYEYRLAILADSYADLKNKVLSINQLNKLNHNIYHGLHKVKEKETVDLASNEITKWQMKELSIQAIKVLQECNDFSNELVLQEICRLYIQGAKIPWETMWTSYQKVNIPTYPFERNKCWLDMGNIQKQSIQEQSISFGNIPDEARKEIEEILRRYKLTSKKLNEEKISKVILTGRGSGSYTKFEKALAEVYFRVLGIISMDIDESFYELGGDSLIAIKVANIYNHENICKLEIVDILKYSSIRKIASHLEKISIGERDSSDMYQYLSKVEEHEDYPLSSPQKRMFVMDWFRNIKSVYNMNRVFLIEGPLDISKTEKAFQTIIDRQESFRTSFLLRNSEPVQIIHKKVEFNIECMEAEEDEIEKLVGRFFRPFQLSQAPLLRVGIIKLESEKNILIMDMHHIISDGTSTEIMMNDFVKLYQGETVEPVKCQYRDYAVWQIKSREFPQMKTQEEYWKSVFADTVPVLNLPLDYERPKDKTFKGSKVSSVLDCDITDQIKSFALQHDITLHILLLSAYYVLLSKYSTQEDIVVGVASSGRNFADIEHTVGMFVNTLAMRNYPRADVNFYDFMVEVREGSYQAYENKDYQLDDLVEQLNRKRDTNRNPLFDVVFTITKHKEVKMEGLKFKVLDMDEIKARFDLILSMCDYDDHIDFSITYCTELFKQETIKNMVKHYQNIIRIVIENKDILIGDIELNGENDNVANSIKEIEFNF